MRTVLKADRGYLRRPQAQLGGAGCAQRQRKYVEKGALRALRRWLNRGFFTFRFYRMTKRISVRLFLAPMMRYVFALWFSVLLCQAF